MSSASGGQATDVSSALPPSPGLFVRRATGLVRGISPVAGLSLNIAFLAAPLLVLAATQIPATWIGASSVWAAAIGSVLCLFPVLAYALFTVVMPRTGGDYVFIGRTLHPWLGFVASFNMAIFGFTLGLAGNYYLFVTFGLSTTFSTIGEQAGSSTLADWSQSVTTANWAFGIGASTAVVIGLLLCLPIKALMRIMEAFAILIVLGLLVTVGVLAVNNRDDFSSAVEAYGGSYQGIIDSASAEGFTPTNSFDLVETLLAAQFIIAFFVWSTGTSYVGGELRNPRRSALLSSVVALGAVSAIAILLFGLAQHVFGSDFLGAATFLSIGGSESYPFATPSFFFFYVTMLADSTALAVIIALGFIAGYLALCTMVMLAAVRSMFAWSFDRVAPNRLAYVSQQGAPVVATVVSLVLTIGYLAYICFGSTVTGLQIYFTLLVGQLFTFLLVGLAAAVFPYRRRDAYEHSSIRRSVGPLPVMGIIGIGAIVVIGYSMYGYLTNDVLGANNTPGLVTWGIFLGLGVVLWPVSYFINRRRGIDLMASGREIPPD
jgi:amino acid transporter